MKLKKYILLLIIGFIYAVSYSQNIIGRDSYVDVAQKNAGLSDYSSAQWGRASRTVDLLSASWSSPASAISSATASVATTAFNGILGFTLNPLGTVADVTMKFNLPAGNSAYMIWDGGNFHFTNNASQVQFLYANVLQCLTSLNSYIAVTSSVFTGTSLSVNQIQDTTLIVYGNTRFFGAITTNGIFGNGSGAPVLLNPSISVTGSVLPSNDNTINLNSASLRWQDAYFGGTIYGTSTGYSGNITNTQLPPIVAFSIASSTTIWNNTFSTKSVFSAGADSTIWVKDTVEGVGGNWYIASATGNAKFNSVSVPNGNAYFLLDNGGNPYCWLNIDGNNVVGLRAGNGIIFSATGSINDMTLGSNSVLSTIKIFNQGLLQSTTASFVNTTTTNIVYSVGNGTTLTISTGFINQVRAINSIETTVSGSTILFTQSNIVNAVETTLKFTTATGDNIVIQGTNTATTTISTQIRGIVGVVTTLSSNTSIVNGYPVLVATDSSNGLNVMQHLQYGINTVTFSQTTITFGVPFNSSCIPSISIDVMTSISGELWTAQRVYTSSTVFVIQIRRTYQLSTGSDIQLSGYGSSDNVVYLGDVQLAHQHLYLETIIETVDNTKKVKFSWSAIGFR